MSNLRRDVDGEVAIHDVKRLIGVLVGVDTDLIPDDQADVIAFAGLDPEGDLKRNLKLTLTHTSFPHIIPYHTIPTCYIYFSFSLIESVASLT